MRTGTGKDEVYSPNKTHYCDLLFLTDHIAIRQPQSNEAFGIENEDNIDEDLYHDDLVCILYSSLNVSEKFCRQRSATF